MPTVNYLRVIGCELNAANWNENCRKDHRKARRGLWRPTCIQINENNPPKMTNSTSIDITFGGARCNRVVAKQEDSHSTAPADKQMNE